VAADSQAAPPSRQRASQRFRKAAEGEDVEWPTSTEYRAAIDVHLPADSSAGVGVLNDLAGYFARFDEPTEIDSAAEGNFFEIVRRGAFAETLKSDRRVQFLLSHGRSVQLGSSPVARIRKLEEVLAGGLSWRRRSTRAPLNQCGHALIDPPYLAEGSGA
jgi:phage head maturation protease